MPAKNEHSGGALAETQPQQSVIPRSRAQIEADLEEAAAAGPIPATFHYFPLPNAYHCFQCKSGRVEVIRLCRTTEGNLIVTPMCEGCSGDEVDALLESGKMEKSADGTFLQIPALGEIAREFEKHEQSKAAAAKKKASKKKASKKKASKKKASKKKAARAR